MVKIDIEKIAGSKAHIFQSWQTQSSPRPRNISLYIAFILLIQGLFSWRMLLYTPSLPPSPPYNASETAALVTQWFKLLQEMHYLGKDAIAYPPHRNERNQHLVSQHAWVGSADY